MRPVCQRRTDTGRDSFRAALASLLECRLRDLPDLSYKEHTWIVWDEYLARRNLSLLWLEAQEDLPPTGYALAVVDSREFGEAQHVIVVKHGQVVHDPNPLAASDERYRVRSYGVLCCLDASKVGRAA